MKHYQIKEISQLTSLSIRTLQYYDDIGLLKPYQRKASGYRLYSEADLLRLQQIVTLKFLDFSLAEIKEIISKTAVDVSHFISNQAQKLARKAAKANEASALLNYIASQMNMQQSINWKSTKTIIELLELNTMYDQSLANDSELGKKSAYDSQYNPERLFPIPRAGKRQEIGINPTSLPFVGYDCWNHYEVSWLNEKGKPIVAIAEITYDCHSPKLIESKSLKLYFNGFNNTKITDISELEKIIKKDLEACIEGSVSIRILPLSQAKESVCEPFFVGESIDDLDITCNAYQVEPTLLSVSDETVEEILYSDLLKSNCLVTNQPDWGSVQIAYRGKKINREGLLQYLVSFRNHNEFHEQCIERIFIDIMNYCKPETLSVYGRYTRRGGLDINPYRSTPGAKIEVNNTRLIRQ